MSENKGGRPVLFDSAEQLAELIEEYFELCDSKTITKLVFKGTLNGSVLETIPSPDPYTIEGLCRHIGCTRETLRQYEKKEMFSYTIKMAKNRIAENTNMGILKGTLNSAAGIFNLTNNFGYKNEYIHDVKYERIIKGLSKTKAAEILSDDTE